MGVDRVTVPTKSEFNGNTPLQDETNSSGTFMDLAELEKFEKIDMIMESPGFPHQPVYAVNHRVLGTLSIGCITYMFSCGGPIGSESVISSGGPLVGLIGFLIYPVLVLIPLAWIVAELCSAFPEDGGFTIWVMNAFGPFWGFQVGFWAWVSAMVSSALIPATLLKIITDFYRLDLSSSTELAIKACIAVVLSLPPLLGSKNVGRIMVTLVAIVVLFFLIFTVWAYSTAADLDDLFELRHENTTYNPETRDATMEGPIDIHWVTLVNTLFHSYHGIYMVSVFGGEVQNPAHAYPRAIFMTVILLIATYIIPMPAGLTSDEVHWSMLDRDSYPLMAKLVGGSFLQTLIIIAAMCGSSGMYIASLYCGSFQVSGMAENHLLPQALAKRNSMFESPHVAILMQLICTLALVWVTFDDLLKITNAFAAAVKLLILATAIHLRRKLPYIPRPTKVPGGVPILLAIAICPTVMFGYITFYAFSDVLTGCIIGGLFLIGLAYGTYRHRKVMTAW